MSNDTLTEMKDSPEFREAWTRVWPKFARFLLEEQRNYASENKGKHEQIGQYVEFMAILTEKLKTLDDVVQAEQTKRPQRHKLHNDHFKPTLNHA